MSEILNTYLLSDPETIVPMDRDEFYKEQIKEYKKNGAPNRAVDIIDVFIFNRQHELLIQKRSFEKNHNPGLLDKSIGGHVHYDDTPDFAVMIETVQELQTPSIVLRSQKDFKKTHGLLGDYLGTIAIIKHSESKIHILEKLLNREVIQIANRTHIYFGVYDGRIRPVDREAKGVLWYSLSELDKEMKKFPETFTKDMHFFLKEYRAPMEEFLKSI
jgi:isopentenyldiphosphate isomerase